MPEEMTPYEKAARLTFLLCSIGVAMTSKEAGKEVGLTRQGADKLLRTISRVIPIYMDDGQVWRRCRNSN